MADNHKTTIAVVDDDIRILQSMEEMLESAGHSVRLFSSAQSLLAAEDLSSVDCVITDISMPAIDGFELRRRVRRMHPDLPVIFMTGRRETSDSVRADAETHHGLFRKPFDATALLMAVSLALGLG